MNSVSDSIRPGSDGSLHNVSSQPGLRASGLSLFHGAEEARDSLFAAPAVSFPSSGRAAIAAALERLGVGRGARVLVPAYHCPAVTGPISWLGAEPVLYRITAGLDADCRDVEARIDERTRAVILIHYFGTPRRTQELAALCKARGLSLIEDCAHTMTGESDAGPIGSAGDYAVASLTKFYPVFDGGLLASYRNSVPPRFGRAPAPLYQLKAAYRPLERAAEAARGGRSWNSIGAWSTRLRSSLPRGVAIASPSAADGGPSFDPAWAGLRASLATRAIVKFTSIEQVRRARRRNYEALVVALARIAGIRVLEPTTPASSSPYALPILVERGTQVARRLRAQRIPVFQWDGSPTGDCETAHCYARSLLQIPCHQDIDGDAVRRIVAALDSALLRSDEQD